MTACGEHSTADSSGSGGAAPNTGNGGSSGSGPNVLVVGAGIGGSGFNQCGVAAALPSDTESCTLVETPTVTNFDDYTPGTDASQYTYYVNANAATALLGGVLHIDDGSATSGGTSVVETAMVTGEGDGGYALQFSDTNATSWGGLLMFYFPSASVACLDASNYSGIQFVIKGSSPSGRFAVSLGMLDTIPTTDNGLCTNSPTSGCKDASIQLQLPTESNTWSQIQLPWGALTPGVGSELSCVPVTGQNISRIVIQPLMNYPAPDYSYEAGAYTITVDNLQFI